MHVCVLTTSYPQWEGDMGGHFVASLARHLSKQGDMEVTVLCPASPGAVGLERSGKLEVRRVRYFYPQRLQKLAYGAGIPWNLRRSFIAWVNIPFLLSAFAWNLLRFAPRCDVIHAHWGVLGALGIALRWIHRRPIVLTVHGSDLRSRIAPIRWITRWAIRNADAVTTPSRQFWGDCCQVRGTDRSCCFLPNGVDAPGMDELERQRHKRRPPRDEVSIVSVGRLVAERRHDVLIRTFARIREQFPSVRLTLVGEGPQRRSLEQLVEELGLAEAVRFTGLVPTSEVARYLVSADLYVSATSVDNFGTAVVEAAAHALPVVTTRVGFPAELVQEGVGGFVVPAEDEDALVDAMCKALEDPEQLRQMGLKMRKRVEELDLTWNKSAERTIEIYRKVILNSAMSV